MKGLLAFVAVTVGLTGSAHAYLKAGPVGYGHWLKATTVQEGMTTSLSAAYSFRKVRSAYAGSAVKLRRTTGGTQDIGFTATGDFDTDTATTFCAATTCFIDTWYDQSANARHMVQAVTASQPQYVADCGNALPCMRTTGAQNVSFGSVTPAGAQSLSTVARVDGAAQACTFVNAGLHSIGSAAETFQLGSGGAPISGAAALTAWHSANGVINGAASVINVDGIEVTGSVAINPAANNLYAAYGGAGANPCSVREAFWWQGYGLTQDERTALANNQKNYWAPLPLDTFQTPAAAYSMRKLKSTYTGPAIRLRRASDNAEQDINFLGFTSFTGAPIDTAAAASHCAATTCAITTWYDQSGGGFHVVNTTPATQSAYVASCQSGLPCARNTLGGTQGLGTPGSVTSVNPLTLSVAARVTVRGSGQCIWLAVGNNTLTAQPATDVVTLNNGSAAINAAATTLNGHSYIGTMNGAASVVSVDGTETTGTTSGSGPGAGYFVGGTGATCDNFEMVYWSGYALTAGERAAFTASQRNFWGIP